MSVVACLGPAGSYSELAARRLCPEKEIMLCANFPAVFAAVTGGAADAGVIPIENSIQGGVLQNLDLLETQDVCAAQQTLIRIDHRLAMLEGVQLSEIRRVYSHEQAIGQCSEFLSTHLPQAECIFTDSTAKSLSLLDGHSAGIVGAHVAKAGVVLSEENIANEKNNFTQFFLIRRRAEGLPDHGHTVFFCRRVRASSREPARDPQGIFRARHQFNAHREPSHPQRAGGVPLLHRDRRRHERSARPCGAGQRAQPLQNVQGAGRL